MTRWRGLTRGCSAALLGGALLGALAAFPAQAQVGPPAEWVLYPHTPEPYCHDPDGIAEFRFAAPQQARLQWLLFSPDSTAVVRTFMDGVGWGGLYTYFWDGRDESAALVPDGRYPYTLVATDVSTQAPLFSASRALTVRCVTAVESPAWTAVKELFR